MNEPAETTFAFRFGDRVRMTPEEWERRVTGTRAALTADGIDGDELASALRWFSFTDDAGWTWMHDGSTWQRWDGTVWTPGSPAGALTPRPFDLQLVDPGEEPAVPATVDADDAYRPTHRVPAEGMAAWEQPDASASPTAMLDPLLDVMVVEWLDNGWARVRCSNDWEAWIDGRSLDGR